MMSTIPDKIEITYVEFANDVPRRHGVGIGALYYAQWRRNGREEYAHADPDEFTGADDSGEIQGIPDDVRTALALLVAPGLVDIKR